MGSHRGSRAYWSGGEKPSCGSLTATDDSGPGLARLSYALLPALLCQGNLRLQTYEALRSP
jgi:hypothetical protein